MKNQFNTLFILALMICSFTSRAQEMNLVGFWKVEKVQVGEENMTPVAKWFKINADGTYQAGNGWLQNGQGNWNYDIENNIYSATDSLGILDEFGGFTTTFDNGNMYWEREEEGRQIKVTLHPTEQLPMSPADYLNGIWGLVEITENEQSILTETDFDKGDKQKLFMRWDRIYINFSLDGKKLTGYWFIDGHKPEITFLPHQEDGKPESWKIEVNKKELLMTGISDCNRTIQRKYVRRNTL